jgi:hypothetical protein
VLIQDQVDSQGFEFGFELGFEFEIVTKEKKYENE